jgi:undecaprenyl diphosphate synthase
MSSQIKHMGIIIDGNRRYSKKMKLSFEQVYRIGANKVSEMIRFIFSETDIPELSIYALSYDNLLRKSTELDSILKVQKEEFDSWSHDPFFHEKKIKINFVGELSLLPKDVLESCNSLMETTKNNDGKTLNILLAYFGTREIVKAVEKILNMYKSKPKDVDVQTLINENLTVKSPVDLIIRTGGASRLSGFLPWQSEYAELYTLKKLWPEIEAADIKTAMEHFKGIEVKKGQ